MDNYQLKYLRLLSKHYPNRVETAKEIVMLSSIMNLTKGSEIFLSDVHGEFEAFQHLMRNGSGIIKQKIKELYSDQLTEQEVNLLSSVIYYPNEKIDLIKQHHEDIASFYKWVLNYLIQITRNFASIYSSRKLRKLLPAGFSDIILELVAEREVGEKNNYYNHLLSSIIKLDQADKLIEEVSRFIQILSVHKVHIIGDVYDRGPGAEIIMDELQRLHAVDFQWGNHDIVWMGAACGSEACMANVLRLSLRYGNTDTLEKGYGIHLMPLASFAIEHYKTDKSIVFDPKVSPDDMLNASEQWLNRLMHKAISIIQFKLEGQLIGRRPEFQLNDRLLLDKINYKKGSISLHNKEHQLRDTFLPTIDPNHPYELSKEEQELVKRLKTSFLKSKRLQQHAQLLFEKGSMYKVTNQNLLYHGCIPLTKEGQFKEVDLGKGKKSGKALMDFFDQEMTVARSGKPDTAANQYAVDLIWYLWAGPLSPLFGKDKMATFERYFLDDTDEQREVKDHYYTYRDKPESCEMILHEFGLSGEDTVILNGHVPVSVKKGESPVKAGGKLVVIDGGFAKAYQQQTGIAGYTLVHNAHGRQLIAQQAFESRKKAIIEELDIAYSETILNQSSHKQKVKDTEDGEDINEMINDLYDLLHAYSNGIIKEKF
ncbi:fructose-1,6-bisphosphatase-3 [Catalinimonas alkaloidigena]|uniref:fructose-1,6-bisphosphatase n=1 Tax=Catalinimonas alkaloidigena TaxID=1075417 RepID=UPI0024073CC3|nr:fructose-1,6-bisphosphatase [Catalinimonas alkaloidigena]MDF9796659.1 fructose-1,6-bisphosphatase-3 [Catalinimonas alkaloidigena]